MSTQPLNGRLFKSDGSFRTRLVLTAGAALAISVPSLFAKLPSPVLAGASASSTISALITADDPNFAADAATAIDALADQDLSLADDTAIVKASLATIASAVSGGSSSLSTATLLDGVSAIGRALASDPTLEGLSKPANELTAILAAGLPGIDGLDNRAQTAAPEIAQNFVAGLLSSGTVPDTMDPAAFAVAVLAKVSTNTSVDELVANAVGQQDQAGLADLAAALFLRYPKADAKITQGITAVTPATSGTSEAGRIAFVTTLAGQAPSAAVDIAQGAVFVDPFHAADFTGAVLNTLSGKELKADATKIATAVGTTLGQDGTALATVGDLYGNLIAAGTLPATSAAAYAMDLIAGAVKGLPSTVPVSYYTPSDPTGDGGTQVLGSKTAATVTLPIAMDLASIVDLIANGVITSGDTGAKGAAEIGVLAEDIARIAKFGTVTDPAVSSSPIPVPVYLAGTLANFITETDPTVTTTTIFADIEKDVTKANVKLKAQIDALFGSSGTFSDYAEVGAIAAAETTVTNL